MYDPQLEKLIDMALEDGVITEKEKNILVKRAQSLGIDLDEFEIYLDSRLASFTIISGTNTNQNKFGNLLKCPSCGASVPSFTATCKDCGFEFRNITANSSMKELAEKLENASKTVVNEKKSWGDQSKWFKVDDIKSEIVRNFPIPNTKDDLMEFAIFISQNIIPLEKFNKYSDPHTSEANEKWLNVWRGKYKQIITKAKILCKDDPSFVEQIINLVKKKQTVKSNYFGFIFICTLGLLSCIFIALDPICAIVPLIFFGLAWLAWLEKKPKLHNWEE